MTTSGEITQLLMECRQGREGAMERLVPLVYDDLRRIAHRHLRGSRGGHTLHTTGLVHEAYLRLVDQTRATYEDRQHFLAVSAIAMRQVIVGHARKRQAQKRGGGKHAQELDENMVALDAQAQQVVELDEALSRLSRHSERLARVVECRFFAGLSEQETAAALGISLRSAQRDWMKARAWLQEELRQSRADGSSDALP